jgi:hypothetical protein
MASCMAQACLLSGFVDLFRNIRSETRRTKSADALPLPEVTMSKIALSSTHPSEMRGRPDVLIVDNSSVFASAEFRKRPTPPASPAAPWSSTASASKANSRASARERSSSARPSTLRVVKQSLQIEYVDADGTVRTHTFRGVGRRS